MGDLIQKLRDATGGSRQLDAEVALALGWRPHMPRRHQGNSRARYEQCSRHPGTFELYIGSQPCGKEKHVPKLTTSLDAIIGLIEEKLPGWKWSINQLDYGCICLVKPPLKTMGDIELQGLGEGGAHSSAPIALCIALLSALEGES